VYHNRGFYPFRAHISKTIKNASQRREGNVSQATLVVVETEEYGVRDQRQMLKWRPQMKSFEPALNKAAKQALLGHADKEQVVEHPKPASEWKFRVKF
jgi:hypothetical protein